MRDASIVWPRRLDGSSPACQRLHSAPDTRWPRIRHQSRLQGWRVALPTADRPGWAEILGKRCPASAAIDMLEDDRRRWARRLDSRLAFAAWLVAAAGSAGRSTFSWEGTSSASNFCSLFRSARSVGTRHRLASSSEHLAMLTGQPPPHLVEVTVSRHHRRPIR